MCPHCSGSINCMADAGRCAASTARRLTSGRQEANAESDNADDAHPCVISAVGKADFFGVRLLSWLHAAPPLEEDPNAGDQRNRVDLSAFIPGKVGGVEAIALVRSEERRVGNDGLSTGRFRLPPYNKKKQSKPLSN